MLASNMPSKELLSRLKKNIKQNNIKINRTNGQRTSTGKSLTANEHIKRC